VTSAIYISLNEGFHNWQALWTSAAYVALGAALWVPRAGVVKLSIILSRLPGNEARAIQPIAVVSVGQPISQSGAPLAPQRRPRRKVECDT
jgi:hypothetical protein